MTRAMCLRTLLVLATCIPGWGGTIVDFPTKSQNRGIFEYSPREREHRFYGGGIQISELIIGADTEHILQGRLRLSNGTFLRSIGGDYFWGSGGKISLQGCVDLNSDRKCDAGDLKGSLITGTFLSTELIEQNGKEVLEAKILDQLNPQLAALLHLPNRTYTGEIDLTLTQIRNTRWWSVDHIQGGSLRDQLVPESPSLWLLGSTLVCLVVSRVWLAVVKKA